MLTTEGRRMFRQYDRFEMHAFARFPKAAVRKFGKICLIVDNVVNGTSMRSFLQLGSLFSSAFYVWTFAFHRHFGTDGFQYIF